MTYKDNAVKDLRIAYILERNDNGGMDLRIEDGRRWDIYARFGIRTSTWRHNRFVRY